MVEPCGLSSGTLSLQQRVEWAARLRSQRGPLSLQQWGDGQRWRRGQRQAVCDGVEDVRWYCFGAV